MEPTTMWWFLAISAVGAPVILFILGRRDESKGPRG
jgi:hypothetical protein